MANSFTELTKDNNRSQMFVSNTNCSR